MAFTGPTVADHRPVCLWSNRVDWLHLLCHSGNQRSSHLCITHHRGWVIVTGLASRVRLASSFSSLILSVLRRKLKTTLRLSQELVLQSGVCFLGVSSQGIPSRWTCAPFTTTASFLDTLSRCLAMVSMAICWQTARGIDGWVLLDMTYQVWGLLSSELKWHFRLSPHAHLNPLLFNPWLTDLTPVYFNVR